MQNSFLGNLIIQGKYYSNITGLLYGQILKPRVPITMGILVLNSRNIFNYEKFIYNYFYDYIKLHDLQEGRRRMAEWSEALVALLLLLWWSRFENSSGIMNFFAIFANFPNFKGKLPLWAKLGDRGTILILKSILQTYFESWSHPRSPT